MQRTHTTPAKWIVVGTSRVDIRYWVFDSNVDAGEFIAGMKKHPVDPPEDYHMRRSTTTEWAS